MLPGEHALSSATRTAARECSRRQRSSSKPNRPAPSQQALRVGVPGVIEHDLQARLARRQRLRLGERVAQRAGVIFQLLDAVEAAQLGQHRRHAIGVALGVAQRRLPVGGARRRDDRHAARDQQRAELGGDDRQQREAHGVVAASARLGRTIQAVDAGTPSIRSTVEPAAARASAAWRTAASGQRRRRQHDEQPLGTGRGVKPDAPDQRLARVRAARRSPRPAPADRTACSVRFRRRCRSG